MIKLIADIHATPRVHEMVFLNEQANLIEAALDAIVERLANMYYESTPEEKKQYYDRMGSEPRK